MRKQTKTGNAPHAYPPMADNDTATWRERWQFRQEMVAHHAWDKWRLPTLQDFETYLDLQRLTDIMETWRPNHLDTYGIGAEGETPLTAEDKDRTEALLWRRIEHGFSDREFVDYAQLLNRWRLEHVPELKPLRLSRFKLARLLTL